MFDWLDPWNFTSWVKSAPDAAKELMIGDESPGSDVVNRAAKAILGFLQELASGGMGRNLVRNSSFENFSDGTTNPPDYWGTLGGPAILQVTGEPDNFGGNNAVKLTPNGSGTGLTQTLSNLKPDTEYSVSARVKSDSSSPRIWTTGAATNMDETPVLPTAFITVNGTFITDSTPTDVVLNVGGNFIFAMYFDKLTVVEGTVPAIYSPSFQHDHNSESEGGQPPSFSVDKNTTNQTGVVTNTWTLLTFSNEIFDTNNDFSANRFTPTVAGKYDLKATVRILDLQDEQVFHVAVYKNGVISRILGGGMQSDGADSQDPFASGSVVVDANGIDDYFEIFGWHDHGSNATISGGIVSTHFSGCKVG